MDRDLQEAKKSVPQRPGGKACRENTPGLQMCLLCLTLDKKASEAEHMGMGRALGGEVGMRLVPDHVDQASYIRVRTLNFILHVKGNRWRVEAEMCPVLYFKRILPLLFL